MCAMFLVLCTLIKSPHFTMYTVQWVVCIVCCVQFSMYKVCCVQFSAQNSDVESVGHSTLVPAAAAACQGRKRGTLPSARIRLTLLNTHLSLDTLGHPSSFQMKVFHGISWHCMVLCAFGIAWHCMGLCFIGIAWYKADTLKHTHVTGYSLGTLLLKLHFCNIRTITLLQLSIVHLLLSSHKIIAMTLPRPMLCTVRIPFEEGTQNCQEGGT